MKKNLKKIKNLFRISMPIFSNVRWQIGNSDFFDNNSLDIVYISSEKLFPLSLISDDATKSSLEKFMC